MSCILHSGHVAWSARNTAEQQLAGWNKPCLEEHLTEIATSITEWRETSPFLGLTEAEEQEILGSAPHSSCIRSQKIAMLRLWKKKKGRAATYNQLCRVFRKSKQLDLEDEMKQILAESNSLHAWLMKKVSLFLYVDSNKMYHFYFSDPSSLSSNAEVQAIEPYAS